LSIFHCPFFIEKVLLAIDIGNTSIKFGTFDGEALASKFIIPTHREYEADDLTAAVADRLPANVRGVIVSSVVPEIDGAVADFVSVKLGTEARFVKASDDFGLKFGFPVDRVGTDRLVNSFAAAAKYGVPVIVAAFGTATTIDVVGKNREYRGGLIAPGPATAAKALRAVTSKLPEVDIAEPPNVIGTDTVTAIRSGIFYSQIGLVETAARHIKAEIGEARLVATGGFAHLIAAHCKDVYAVDANLTLEGLKKLADSY